MELLAVASSAVAITSGICAIILFFVGRKKAHHDDGEADGAFCGYWYYTASGSSWDCAARPRLKNP